MAESPSSALPGGVEWLSALGGARLLRAEVGPGDPPALVLKTVTGGEHRVDPGPQARFSRSTDYLVPADVDWTAAWLQWPDGTRAVMPRPEGRRANIIRLPVVRPTPQPGAAPPSPAPSGLAPSRPGVSASSPRLSGFVPSALGGAVAPSPALGTAASPLPWTAPPWSEATDAASAAAAWRAQRAQLELDLVQIAEAIVRACQSERATHDAVLSVLDGARSDLHAARAARAADASLLADLSGELDAHAATRAAANELRRITSLGARGDLAPAAAPELAAMRTELERACHDAAAARNEVAALRALLEEERVARARAESALREVQVRPRIERHAAAQATAAAASLRRPPHDTGELVAALDAAAVSLRAAVPAPREDDPSAVERSFAPAAGRAAAQATRAAVVEASPWRLASRAAAAALVAAGDVPGLRRALVELAREDSVAAGALLAALLPAHGAALEGSLSYDLTIRGAGMFAVTVRDGFAEVEPLARRRSRREAEFHLSGEPLVLAELLAGDRREVRRLRRGAKLQGRRRRAAALSALPESRISLAQALAAGARLEPALVYRALPYAVAPEWTRGHVFTVAQEIVELAPRAWYITARDGVRLTVAEHTAGAAADATVTMTRAAFERLLRGDPPADGERPLIRGDHEAVAALKRWTDLARGER